MAELSSACKALRRARQPAGTNPGEPYRHNPHASLII